MFWNSIDIVESRKRDIHSNRTRTYNSKSNQNIVPVYTIRGGSRMRGAPGTLVFASHLHPQPHPEVRVCATNIFTGSDIVAATIFRFVNGRCHHYISSTCVTFCLSSEIDITPRVWKLNCLFQTKLSERIDIYLGYKDLLICFVSAFTV